MSGIFGSLGAGISGLSGEGFLAQLLLSQWEEVSDGPLVQDAIRAPHEAVFERGREFYANRQFEDAVAAFEEAVRLKPDFARAHNNLGCARFGADGPHAALGAFEIAISVDPEFTAALFNKGVTLNALDRNDEAIAIYDDVIARFGNAPEPSLREAVAMALVNKASSLSQNDGAIAIYDDVIARFGNAPEPALRDAFAKALFNKGIRLGALGRNDEAIAIYDDVIARFGNAPQPALREVVAGALFNKGIGLIALGRNEDEIAIYDDVIARFGNAPEPTLRTAVAMALINKGSALGQNDGAIAIYDDVIARFAAAPEPALREAVAMALFNKGNVLGLNSDAIAIYDDVIARFGNAPEPALRRQVSNALYNKGVTLSALGWKKEATAIYDDVIARFGNAPEPALREAVAMALFNKGNVLGLNSDAIAIYDDVIARFGNAPEPALRKQVFNALYSKGVTLGSLRRFREAVATLREVRKFTLHIETRRHIAALIKELLAKTKEYNNGLPKEKTYNMEVDGGYTTETHARGAREFRHALKPLPEGLTWPRPRIPEVPEADRTDDDYDRAPECGKPGGLKLYLERVWGEIRLRHIDMPTLRERWPRLGQAIDRQRRMLPKELLPPLKEEVVDRELESEWVQVKDIGRLTRARHRRLVKARQQASPSPK